MTRVYVPGDWNDVKETLATVRQAGHALEPRWNLGTRRGYAVTAELRAALPDLDEESLEHYAMTEAAQASLENFHDEGEPMRRLVLAVDVEDVEAVPDAVCEVRAELAVPHDVAAWLVDTESARESVARVAGRLPLHGSESAEEAALVERAVEACLDHELAWFAVTETDVVLELS
ncbi:hypothetical protein KDN32_04115 [Nocardioides sp. J2M5]|uniref:DUF6912 family protein n=1 Tax=Nocardioides palaemonis TaxID=2829810 RepID=UPI001BAAFBD4|nr:hypothetical protein [Nocardioides palaemonis]MBS2936928.1 hypothetical protein [Nocardioides palaemonis]